MDCPEVSCVSSACQVLVHRVVGVDIVAACWYVLYQGYFDSLQRINHYDYIYNKRMNEQTKRNYNEFSDKNFK